MKLRALFVIVAAVIFAAVVFFQERAPEIENTLLLPTLKSRLSGLSRVTIGEGSEVSVTLVREADNWVVSELQNYPADFSRLSGFLTTLSKLEIAERKTNRPENHAKLGLSASGEGAGKHVTIEGDAGETSLWIGGSAGSRGNYVRVGDDPQVYLTDLPVRLKVIPDEWVNSVIVNIGSEDIVRVEIEQVMGEKLVVYKDSETNEYVLENQPEGTSLRYETIVDGFGRLLTNPRFENVAPLDDSIFTGAVLARFKLVTGDELIARSVELDGSYWLHIDQPEIAQWQFSVSAYTYGEFTKTMTDLLKE